MAHAVCKEQAEAGPGWAGQAVAEAFIVAAERFYCAALMLTPGRRFETGGVELLVPVPGSISLRTHRVRHQNGGPRGFR